MGTFDDATFHLVDPRAPNEGTVARPGTVSWFYDCPPPSPCISDDQFHKCYTFYRGCISARRLITPHEASSLYPVFVADMGLPKAFIIDRSTISDRQERDYLMELIAVCWMLHYG